MFQSKLIGQKIIHLKEAVSTNAYAMEMVKNGVAQEGMVIRADYQKSGRGQNDLPWESEPGANLLISVILKPSTFPAILHFHLNRFITLAVYDFIDKLLDVPVTIKWPNDIMAGDRKIAGLLIENIVRNSHIQWSVAGIGVNINQSVFKEYLPQATSVNNITGKKSDLALLTGQLSDAIEKWYVLFKFNRYEKIREEYQKVLYKAGTPTRFEDSSGKFTGTIKGALEDGRLIIEDELNKMRLYSNKEITFIF
jgi:BirA family transcriptional regulator, biotin operon repressor / biotin---[acetyl-CoA-carboxylase] ligase